MKGFRGAFVAPLIGVALNALPEKSGNEGDAPVGSIGVADADGASKTAEANATPATSAVSKAVSRKLAEAGDEVTV